MKDIFNRITHSEVIHNVPNTKLPECNRGSWYCPAATIDDARALDELCSKHGLKTVYDLGAGTLELSIAMDSLGYNVVAYESINALAEYALERHGNNNVEVRTRDYYADWPDIRAEEAAFVALGKVNCVPGNAPNGVVVDGMGVIV